MIRGLEEAVALLRASDDILLTTHRNPDGDGIGSQLALYDALTALGKRVRMHNRDGVPRIYRFLPHADVVGAGPWPREAARPGLIVSLDCGARSRLGLDDAFFADVPLLNIDHHASNTRFGTVDVVDPAFCATGAIVRELLRAMEVPLGPASASALFAALLTDTASFRLESADASAHRLAAELIEAGARPGAIARAIYASRSLAGLHLLRLCLNSLEMRDDGRSAWMHVTRSDYESSGATVEDTEGLIDFARSIAGVEIAVFLRPEGHSDHRWKASFRGKTQADVGALAGSFGGGGHRHAAGCTLDGSLEEVRALLHEKVSDALRLLDEDAAMARSGAGRK
ncbi:MAG: DHH family phosphoesterase [Mariprofundaceae bacterium]